MSVFNSLKNLVSKLDRLLGYRIWRIFWRKQLLTDFKFKSSVAKTILDKYFPDLESQDPKSKLYHSSLGDSYIAEIGKSYIEGGTGWLYHHFQPHRLSYPYARYPWRQIFYPHFLFHLIKITMKKKIKHKRAVNLIWHGWSNYYHFLIDILPILNLLDANYEKVSVLVPSYIKNTTFIQDYFQMFPQKYMSLNFVYVEPFQVIGLEQSILASASRFLALPEFKSDNSKGYSRLFLMRSLEGSRTIVNLDEIQEVLAEFRFQIVDTSGMSFQEQIETFQDVRALIGIHGAGMTNLIFSKKIEQVVEIFPGGVYRPFHYKHLCLMKGDINYHQISGSTIIDNTNLHFRLSPMILRKALEKIDNNLSD